MLQLLVGSKQKNKLRNNINVFKQLSRWIEIVWINQPKPQIGKINNIHQCVRSDLIDVHLIIKLRDLENNQNGRQIAGDRYHQEAQHILQRKEQEISMR